MFWWLLGLGIPAGSVCGVCWIRTVAIVVSHMLSRLMYLCIYAHTSPWGSSLQIETEALRLSGYTSGTQMTCMQS